MPETTAPRRCEARSTMQKHIAKTVAEWPPLTTAQRDKLALLLRGESA